MNVHEYGVAGYYTLEKLNEKDEVVYSTSFKNLITDMGFNAFLTRDLRLSTVAVFVDTVPPNAGMSTIGVAVHYTTNTVETTSTGMNTDYTPYMFFKSTYMFDIGVIKDNINRIAVLYGSSNVFSISAIKDHLNNDTTIQIQPNERLRVTYELRVYQPEQETVIFPNVDIGDDGVTDITVRTAFTAENWISSLIMNRKWVYSPRSWRYDNVNDIFWNTQDILEPRMAPNIEHSYVIGELGDDNVTVTLGKYKEKDCLEFKMVIRDNVLPDRSLKTVFFHTGFGGFQIGYGKVITRTPEVKKTITIKLYIAVTRV